MSYKYYNDFIYNKKIPYNIITQFEKMCNRGKNIFNIENYINKATISYKIEKGIFEYSVLYILNNNYKIEMFPAVYNYKTESIIQNIQIDKNFLKDIRKKNIDSRNIAFMTPSQINPNNWKEITFKQHAKEEEANNIPTTNIYKCKRCGERKCITRIAQTRAADESLNVLVICTICNNSFII
jgi:DNA-directed RNA polymerase subunit M/transcription elongation factor TFIIS